NLLSISIPFLAGFDRRLKFYRQWKYLFPAMLLTMMLFIPWDVIFTEREIWGFTPKYLSGIDIINLPIEEWLFFIAIPYACVFTYESLKYLVKKDYLQRYVSHINYSLIIVLGVLAVIYHDHAYTFVTFSLTVIFLLMQQFVIRGKYLGRFYFSFLFVLVPFFIVNGILTGSFIEDQVVWYNDAENMGIRMFTIPVEDSVYALLMLMMNVSIYEFLKSKY
ncbi:MAG: lycopene cyclase domain-containing protein, partial [Bacteroidales bacterium]|nr:lycopene cyclase domain-containing protein [Bacteroidales bacterium]